ncbi:MAG: biopolymer transporter ExbD [Bacteroidales bacterium]|nr:biopolymer transporter ExbD [Bacteroidales bacterium]MBN2632615.1 biopolymer transporter ExbD [Bacteroidales bacterium]
MALSQRNKISISFSSTGMTDVVFNLLIFFMLTSTLVHPTALKLLLPQGDTQTSAKPLTTVSITADERYYMEQEPMESLDALETALRAKLGSEPDTYISLHVDKSAPFGSAVPVMNIAQKNNYKLIIATTPK